MTPDTGMPGPMDTYKRTSTQRVQLIQMIHVNVALPRMPTTLSSMPPSLSEHMKLADRYNNIPLFSLPLPLSILLLHTIGGTILEAENHERR